MPPVAVVIPAYNEAERIGETVTAALSLPGVDVVVVASDGSTDATVRQCEERGRDGVAVAAQPGQGGRHARGGGGGRARWTSAIRRTARATCCSLTLT